MKKTCIVVTTIGNGEFLDEYCNQADTEGLGAAFRIIVIPDRKSPASIFSKCASLSERGYQVLCPTVEDQDAYLRQFSNLALLVPYNSDNRRNIGFLMALEWGVEVLISLDDDNLCIPSQSTYAAYQVVGNEKQKHTIVDSPSRWFNICDMLEIPGTTPVYPRGFPYAFRHRPVNPTMVVDSVEVHLNAGLWLGEPDLDAITWLVNPVRSTAMNSSSLVLARDTWSPINTQNTSLIRDAITSYYFIKMGYPLGGMPIDRYGDIFSGYFCAACVKHLGAGVRVGTPVAMHKRNSHNYLKDAANEMACILVLEDLLGWLPTAKLDGNNYSDSYLSLAAGIEHAVQGFRGSIWTDATRGYFHQMAYCMREWVKACKQIG